MAALLPGHQPPGPIEEEKEEEEEEINGHT
jgi:hypothetical protein